MYEITMPKLSDSMQEGKIIAWKVKQGDRVREGDVLAEVESDKATMELECFHTGTLARIVHGDGSEVAIGEVIGIIESATKGAEAPAKPQPAAKTVEKETPAFAKAMAGKPAQEPEPVEAQEAAEKEESPVRKPKGAEVPKAAAALPTQAEPKPRVAVSPFARKLGETQKIDLRNVKGTGPGGRITARDIGVAVAAGSAGGGEAGSSSEALAEEKAPAKADAAERPAIKPSPDEELPAIDVTSDEAEVVEASFRQKTQARRVVAAKHVIPHFYITRGVDMTGLFAKKEELKEKYGATITHLVMLACLKALKLHPEVNRSYDRGKIIKWNGVNLGLAVDTDEGLTVAVVPGAQRLSLKEIVERTRSLIAKARAGKLSPEERRHPTFTVSSLGMFDVENFQPIINPPSAVTLAVSSALATPVVKEGMILIGRIMKLTLSCDHRIVDGVTAAKFLADLKKFLENEADLLAGEWPAAGDGRVPGPKIGEETR